jgi:hypothetical protein
VPAPDQRTDAAQDCTQLVDFRPIGTAVGHPPRPLLCAALPQNLDVSDSGPSPGTERPVTSFDKPACETRAAVAAAMAGSMRSGAR